MRRILCSLPIVGLFSVLHAFQQPGPRTISKPDLTGNWTNAAGLTLEEGRGNGPDGKLLVGSVPTALVISKDGTNLIIEEHRQFVVTRNRLEHGLNGETVKADFVIAPPRPAAPAEMTSKWEGQKLVSAVDVFVPGESDPRHYVETMSISPEGILAVRMERIGTTDSRTLFYRKAK